MKKLALALVCLVSVAFFASCTPKGNPTITVLQEEGYVKDGDVVTSGQEFNFGFVVASSIETSKELSTLVITIDDEEAVNENLTGTEYTYKGALTLTLTRELPTAEIKAVVTDAAGATATATITVSIEESTALVETTIQWTKVGHNAQDLSDYGLFWKETNYKTPFTHIIPAENFTMFLTDGDKYESIKTAVDLANLFTTLNEDPAVQPCTDYAKIDCNATARYNDLLITKDAKGGYHAIHVTGATITSESQGTKIVIEGKAK